MRDSYINRKRAQEDRFDTICGILLMVFGAMCIVLMAMVPFIRFWWTH